MNVCHYFSRLLFTLLLASSAAHAEGLRFGILGKSTDDINFVDTWRGCSEEAQRFGDQCLHLGNAGPAHPRSQAQAIEAVLLNQKLDGLAISVTSSHHIARVLQNTKVPLFTFDSPFAADDARLSHAYIGINNLEFGRSQAKIAKHLRPQGGTVCIITAAHDANLAQRVAGIRQELSGNPKFPAEQRLSGEGGWSEPARCPWNTADDAGRAIAELEYTLNRIRPEVILSVGHWPVLNPSAYRQTLLPFGSKLQSGQLSIIVGVGRVLPAQAELLKQKLVSAFVSIDFGKMGQQAYLVMKAAAEGKPYAAVNETPNQVRLAK